MSHRERQLPSPYWLVRAGLGSRRVLQNCSQKRTALTKSGSKQYLGSLVPVRDDRQV